jgi:tetratricopeptide (TPR) repeat protein
MAAPQSARELFLAALERPPAERAAYLEAACAGDAALRQRVEALLAAHDEPGAFLSEAQPPPAGGATAVLAGSEAGAFAGRYTLLQRIGEGGMGEVWVARQTEPVKRKVALKLIKAGMDTRAVLQRFEAERQALALMDHPNIARVLDGGMTAERRSFFVMELVNGLPLTRFCDEARLGIRERLELFVAICQAVQHAHQKGIIHRDLKPSNILVTLIDGRPVPRVIDFGVAKAIGGKLLDESLSTQFGAVVGTLEYMAPEQAGYSGSDIDTRADIYSLGVILYELLTGLRPIDAGRLREAPLNEIIRIIREEEPTKPSTRLSTDEALPTLAAARHIEPKRLMALLRGELDWVVMKCLEKQRERRYETASALARDVQRYLADEPVEARPPSAGYRLRKFVRRHPLELALAGAVALLVLGGGTVAWWQNEQAGARRETDLRRLLEDEKRSAADTAWLGRNAEAVAALLGECEKALKAGDAAKAKVALDAARKRSAEGGADEQAQRLGRLAADLALSRDLDADDQFRWTWAESKFPGAAVAVARTRQALRRFGADPDAVPVDEAAARVSASVVRERIVTALDRLLQHEKTAGVRAVLRRVDADPYRDAVRDAVLADNGARVAELAGQEDALKQPPGFAAFLGDSPAIAVRRRRELLLAAVSRRTADVDVLMTLGNSDYQRTADVGALVPFVRTSTDKRDEWVNERLRWYQAAAAAAPANAAAHNNVGATLCGTSQWAEAIPYLRKAIELDPTHAVAHTNLGHALRHNGQLAEAIPYLRKAIELDPTMAVAHNNLGLALEDKGEPDEAIEYFRKATAFDPKFAAAFAHLGHALSDKGKVDEAIACYRKVIALAPKNAPIRRDLGGVLRRKGQLDEAIRHLRKAIALDPKFVEGHVSLGAALCDGKKDYDGATACFERALALNPSSAAAHTCLGVALAGKGHVDKAIARFRKALELDPKHVSARFNLACAWAHAAELAPADQARLRQQALDLLREALALQARQLETGTSAARATVRGMLRHWQQDPDLASIRDATALAKLPAQEEKAFTQLWADVGALLKKAEAPTPRAARADRPTPILSALEDALEVLKARLGPDHPRTLRTMKYLAEAYREAGKLDRAVPLFEGVLKFRKARLGPDHPDTLLSMSSLASVYWALRQLDKSIHLLEVAAKGQEAKLGRDHPDTLRTVAGLGVSYKDAGRLREAIPLLEEAHRAARKYPKLAWVSAPLIDAYTRAGENAKLAALLGEELPAVRKALPPDSPQLAGVLAQIGLGFLGQKKWAEAEPLLRECLAIREKTQPDAWTTFNTQSMLGGVLLGQKKYQGAEPLLRAGYAGMKERERTIPPQGRPRLVEAAERLVQLYEALGKKDEVARWVKELEALEAVQKKAEKKR